MANHSQKPNLAVQLKEQRSDESVSSKGRALGGKMEVEKEERNHRRPLI